MVRYPLPFHHVFFYVQNLTVRKKIVHLYNLHPSADKFPETNSRLSPHRSRSAHVPAGTTGQIQKSVQLRNHSRICPRQRAKLTVPVIWPYNHFSRQHNRTERSRKRSSTRDNSINYSTLLAATSREGQVVGR